MAGDQPTGLEADGANAIGRALGLLADEWTLLILRQTLSGQTRYGELKSTLPISNSVLTQRLTRLTGEGLLARRVYQDNPVRAEYLTTERSRALCLGMLTLRNWEKRWAPDSVIDEAAARHVTCDRDLFAVVACRACGTSVTARDVVAEWGPSGSWQRSSPEAVTRRRPERRSGRSVSGQSGEAMMLFGNRWSAAVICAAFRGVTRFTQFEASLGAPPTLISDRLKVLQAIGVLSATQDDGHSTRVEYRLTEKGHALFPVLSACHAWSERWFSSSEGPALAQTHAACGKRFIPEFCCEHCGGTLGESDFDFD